MARMGGNKAALKLANHYIYSEDDLKSGLEWLELAAKRGDRTAIEGVSTIKWLLQRESGEQK